MKVKTQHNRRRFLKYAAIATAGAATYPAWAQTKPVRRLSKPSANFHPDVEIKLTQKVTHMPVFNGEKTRVWKVWGKVLKGSNRVLENHDNTYLAPTIRLKQGQKVRIYLHNDVPTESILHWHGLHVPAEMDGNPMYAIKQGERFIYEFEILNRAGTYWYHAHTHSVTAKQVYSGLAGLFIVSDQEEQALSLPQGQFDVPLVIQDRSFDNQNQLVYAGHRMQRMQGFLGEQILVNGQPDFVLPVATRSYRLRLLNGSNSRIYKLAWDDGTPLTIIGVDGGLLEKPLKRKFVMLAPAERIELWVDFSAKAVGTEMSLRSIPFSVAMHGPGGMMGGRGMGMMGGRGMGMGMMGGGMKGRKSLPLGGDYPIFKVKVITESSVKESLPTRLTPVRALRRQDAQNADKPRTITLSMRHMSALLNGRSYAMDDVRSDEIFPVNSLQVIEFDNGYSGGMMGMAMPHPMHLHGEQFQILKREVRSEDDDSYASVASGFVDEGWKDTVLVMPGEKVTVLKPFNDFKGMFMYHCHNLEHEDMGMMRDFLIK